MDLRQLDPTKEPMHLQKRGSGGIPPSMLVLSSTSLSTLLRRAPEGVIGKSTVPVCFSHAFLIIATPDFSPR